MAIIGLIGTAGRDKTKHMPLELYLWMLRSAYMNIPKGSHVGSGGAAWADHLSVSLFLFGHASELTLHLPAPFENGRYVGPPKGAAQAANFYHEQFSRIIKRDTLGQIAKALTMPNVHVTYEKEMAGFGGFFARNAKVAKMDKLYAYTFGLGEEPADGGTKHTWDLCQNEKHHITLPNIENWRS